MTSPEMVAVRDRLASLLLGLGGETQPVVGQQRIAGEPDIFKTVTPETNPLAGVPGTPGNLLQPAGMTAQETAGLKQLGARATPGMTPEKQLLNQTVKGRYLGDNPFLQQYIQEAQRSTAQTYEEVLGRTLPGQFTKAGQQVQPGQSSAFDRAAAIQSRGLADALGGIATNIGFGAYESERERQQEAATQRAAIRQQEVEATLQNLQAQALPRLIQEKGLEQGRAEFNRRSTMLLQLLQIMSGGGAQNIVQPPAGAPNTGAASLLGGIGSVGGAIVGGMYGGPAGATAGATAGGALGTGIGTAASG
jgi:hypothetical protein